MTTEKQIEANQQNALQSTGPKTDEGKTVSRGNALKHGLLSEEVLMKGEKQTQLEELGKRLRSELAPHGELENLLVDRIVSSSWRLKRAIRVERDLLNTEYETCENDEYSLKKNDGTVCDGAVWDLVVRRLLGEGHGWLHLTRYETTIERQIYKALHELLRLQSARRGEKPPLPVAIDIDLPSSD